MSNEHNPIAQLISQLQQEWINEVSPYGHINLVRWIIKPDQSKLYEGFLRLESTEHGSIPEMLMVLLTPFTNENLHSEHLIKEWIKTYRDNKELIESYQKQNSKFSWDADKYENQLTKDKNSNNSLLVEILSSFQKELPDNIPLVLGLLPYTIYNVKAYSKWLRAIMKISLPKNVRLMIFDHVNERHFDTVCDKHKDISKSLSVPLDLEGAVNKLASAGDPNDPEVQFRHCILKMSKSVQNKNLPDLKKWGEKGIEIALRTGQKSMLSTAHIIYASMLFSFKEYETIDNLLLKGLALAKQGLQAGDDTCKALIIQYYGFQASSKQLQKKYKDAADLFCKQADTSIEIGFPQQSLNAWWMAYNAIKKRDKERYRNLVEKAYSKGIEQDKETLKSTTMSFIAADYYSILEREHKKEGCLDIDTFMLTIEGEGWRENVESQRKSMEKKRLSISNWF